MSATAEIIDATPESLDLYRQRDELAQTFNPTNAYERMLVTQVAQSWHRLQRAREAENRYFKDHDVIESIVNRLAEFKAVTHYAADCERSWRQATAAVERLKRERKRDLSSPNMRRNASPAAFPMPEVAEQRLPLPTGPTAQTPHSQRE